MTGSGGFICPAQCCPRGAGWALGILRYLTSGRLNAQILFDIILLGQSQCPNPRGVDPLAGAAPLQRPAGQVNAEVPDLLIGHR